MEVSEKMPAVGFDSSSFWQQADSILLEGKRDMLRSVQKKSELVESYCRMDCRLRELIERTNPPQETLHELKERVMTYLGIVGWSGRNVENADPAEHWSGEKRNAALMILKSTEGCDVIRLHGVIGDAVDALSRKGNFTDESAHRLLAEIASHGCKDLENALDCLAKCDTGRELVTYLQKNGNPKAKEAAAGFIAKQLPEELKKPAVVIRPPAEVWRTPLRQIR